MGRRQAPGHLSKEAKAIWNQIAKDWELSSGDYPILRIALESYDRGQEARRRIDEDGIVLTDDKGKRYAHPCLAVEKECRMGLLRAWRQLRLDVEVPRAVGRPPGPGGY